MRLRPLFAALGFMVFSVPWAFAGPPFFTDDPEPVPYKQAEFYAFTTVDHTSDGTQVAGPAFEFNYGAAPNLQLHIIFPMQLSAPTHGPTTFGIGDMELGVKYRFLQEKSHRPQIGTFPMVEVPTGNSARGLGNGGTWYKLPVWAQKNFGHGWQSYGGGGYLVNPAPGMRNTPFFGWQVQKELNKKLTLGGEWFNPGRLSVATGNTQLLNFGGIYNFYKNMSLLFTLGHSVEGDSHTLAYVGLYWIFGAKPEEEGMREKELKPAGLFPLLHNTANTGQHF